MTRVAIVADSEELRAALSVALRGSSTFDVVSESATVDAISTSADVVVVARPARARHQVTGVRNDAIRRSEHAPALTLREREILDLLADGLGNKQIAGRLGISTNTVKTHLELLFEKLDVASRAEAVASAVRRGWLFL